MGFQPNRLVVESGQKLVMDCFGRGHGLRLSLRPARRCLFVKDPEVPSLQVELSKPAFAALVRDEDAGAPPCLVLETDTISPGIRELYRLHDIPFVEAEQSPKGAILRFERDGLAAKFHADADQVARCAATIVEWATGNVTFGTGPLLRSRAEVLVFRAFSSAAKGLDLDLHHHVPFGYAAGYRPDLPRSIARHPVEVLVVRSACSDPQCSVVLPVRVVNTTVGCHRLEPERDREVAEFVCSVSMPMAAFEFGQEGCSVTFSLNGFEERTVSPDDEGEMVKASRDLLEEACAHIGIALAS